MWELSLIVSVLGTSFFFIYLANSLDSENKILQGLKFLFTGAALILMVVNAGVSKHILTAANASMPTISVSYASLQSNLNTNLYIIVGMITLFFMLSFIYIFMLIFPSKLSTDKEGDDE